VKGEGMIIFESLSKKLQSMVKKFRISKDMIDKAKATNDKCRDMLINEFCTSKNITSEKIVFEDGAFVNISGAPRTDTAWAKVWKDFDTSFYPLIADNVHLSGEYLKLRRSAEVTNKKSPYMRWEITKEKDGKGHGTSNGA
jgi:hypothetical protein